MNILLITPDKNDSTSFYRASGVFGTLSKTLPNVNIINFDMQSKQDKKTFTWADFNMIDIVFMQRPHNIQTVRMADYIKKMNIPLWIDYDDNLFELPQSNSSYLYYQSNNVIENVTQLLNFADIVSVSTNHLKIKLRQYNKNIKVIPNAFNDYLFDVNRAIDNQKNFIIWRGGNTHQLDLMLYTDVIVEVFKKYEKFSWYFLGYHPWFISHNVNSGRFISKDAVDPMVYHDLILKNSPKLFHIPLQDSSFNRSKSNIALLEGAYTGAVCLVPDWEEWRLPGVLKYNNPEDYKKQLTTFCENKINIKKQNKLTWNYICDNLLLSKINKKRAEIIKTLT